MLRIGKTPVLFYKKKIIVTGMRNPEELEDVIEKLVGILHRHSIRAEPKDYEIVNVTAKLELGRRINLVEAAEKLGGIYDPDYRPYLVTRINDTVVMLTHNGKLVILGARSNDVVVGIVKLVANKLKKLCSNQRL